MEINLQNLLVGVAVVCLVLFGADFFFNGYADEIGKTGNSAASFLDSSITGETAENTISAGEDDTVQVQIGEMGQDSTVSAEEGGIGLTASVSTDSEIADVDEEKAEIMPKGVVSVGVDKASLEAVDFFTPEVFTQAGMSEGKILDLRYTTKIFDFFELTEVTQEAPLKKRALYDGDHLLAYIYEFPSASYALGVSYRGVRDQVRAGLKTTYLFSEPGSFSEQSFYVTSSDPNNKQVVSLAQIGNTLVGFAYTRDTYASLQKIVDVINKSL